MENTKSVTLDSEKSLWKILHSVTRQGPSVDASRVTAVTFQSQFAMNALDPDFADYCKKRGGGQVINSLILRVLRFQGTVYVISSRMYFTGKGNSRNQGKIFLLIKINEKILCRDFRTEETLILQCRGGHD